MIRFEFLAEWTRTQKNEPRRSHRSKLDPGEHPIARRGRRPWVAETAASSSRSATVIIDRVALPVYLRIAAQAKHLRELGMSHRAIVRALGVSDKTVTKNALWGLRHAGHSSYRASRIYKNRSFLGLNGGFVIG
jgi:hypothetical protein